MGELHVGAELFGILPLDVLETRQRRSLWVSHVEVVHCQNWEEGRKGDEGRQKMCINSSTGKIQQQQLGRKVDYKHFS